MNSFKYDVLETDMFSFSIFIHHKNTNIKWKQIGF